METQVIILYEITVLETDKCYVTLDRDEALDRYREGCMVFETHKTVTQPSTFTQTRIYVTLQWHNNPDFNPDF
jgi:hypothetical protein